MTDLKNCEHHFFASCSSLWWCTILPSLIAKNCTLQKLSHGQNLHTQAQWFQYTQSPPQLHNTIQIQGILHLWPTFTIFAFVLFHVMYVELTKNTAGFVTCPSDPHKKTKDHKQIPQIILLCVCVYVYSQINLGSWSLGTLLSKCWVIHTVSVLRPIRCRSSGCCRNQLTTVNTLSASRKLTKWHSSWFLKKDRLYLIYAYRTLDRVGVLSNLPSASI